MAERSTIEWTDATWNPITGCAVVSPGCTNCYAMRLAGTRLRHHPSRRGLTRDGKAGPVWTGEVRLNREWLDQPLRWRQPRRIFVCAHGDLFAEEVPDEWIDQVFAVMALAPRHTFQVLTKRSARMRAYLTDPDLQNRISVALGSMLDGNWIWSDGKRFRNKIEHLIDVFLGESLDDEGSVTYHADPLPLPNVWLGVSVEDQRRADERVPDLLATPAAIRFVSAEPLCGPVDLGAIEVGDGASNALQPYTWEQAWDDWKDTEETREAALESFLDWFDVSELRSGPMHPRLDWVIAGGESGSDARPMHPDWARSLRDQCATAGVSFFFKQWGEWVAALDRERDDPDWRADYGHAFANRGVHRWLNHAGGCGFHGESFHVMRRIGKAAAGRLLDGVEHNGFPNARSVA